MARKGKPWGPSNPLWRWQHRRKGTKLRPSGIKRAYREKAARTRKARRRTRTRRASPRTRTMARRRYGRRRGRRSKGIPVLSLGIAVGQALTAWNQGGSPAGAAGKFVSYYTGFDPSTGGFDAKQLLIGYGPWVAKGFVMKLARGVGARPRLFPGLSLS